MPQRSDETPRPARKRRNTTLSRLLAAPFKSGSKPVQTTLRATVGPLLTLDDAVQFLDKDKNRFDVTATNDIGALLVGIATGLKQGDQLRLGRRMNAGVVFALCTITRIEQRSNHPLRRIWIQWDAFTGTSEKLVGGFLDQRMRVSMLERFQVGAATTGDDAPMSIGNQQATTTGYKPRMGPLGVVERADAIERRSRRITTTRQAAVAVPRFQAGTDGQVTEG